jgi:hypothetical protein
VRARVVALDEMSAGDLGRWNRLRAQALEPYPFLDPRLLVPAARHRDGVGSMRMLLIEDDDRLLLLMPFVRGRGVGPVPLGIVSSEDPFLVLESGWQHPLVDHERSDDVLAELFGALRTLHLPGLIDFDWFPVGSALGESLSRVARRTGVPVLERRRFEVASARRAPDREDVIAAEGAGVPAVFDFPHFGSGTRKKQGQYARRLQQAVGSELLEVNRGDDPAALDEFLALQAAGWKGDSARGGAALSTAGNDAWFRDVAAAFRADGDFGLYTLVAGGTVIHMQAALRSGSTVYGYADAYDERFAEFRPGALGRVAAVNRALTEPGNQLFNPNLSPHYVESTRLFPDREQVAQLLVAPGGPAGRAVVRAIPFGRRLRERLRPAR